MNCYHPHLPFTTSLGGVLHTTTTTSTTNTTTTTTTPKVRAFQMGGVCLSIRWAHSYVELKSMTIGLDKSSIVTVTQSNTLTQLVHKATRFFDFEPYSAGSSLFRLVQGCSMLVQYCSKRVHADATGVPVYRCTALARYWCNGATSAYGRTSLL